MEYSSLTYHSSHTESSETTPKHIVSKVNTLWFLWSIHILACNLPRATTSWVHLKAAHSPQTDHNGTSQWAQTLCRLLISQQQSLTSHSRWDSYMWSSVLQTIRLKHGAEGLFFGCAKQDAWETDRNKTVYQLGFTHVSKSQMEKLERERRLHN